MKDFSLKEAARVWGGSILTIRNRWNVFMGMPLSDAIAAARKEMPTLKYFHAVFCRSNMLGDDPKAAQSVRLRNVV
jgi:hypothetical protein